MRVCKSCIVVAAALALLGGPITATPSSKLSVKQPPTILFFLNAESTYVEGCFPAPPVGCAGPLFLASSFEGIYGSTFAGFDEEGFTLFEISNFMAFAFFGDDVVVVIADGLYRRNEAEGKQELTLDALVDGVPSTFNSGVVPIPPGPHEVDIAVNMNDLINQDILMHIVANPGAAFKVR